METQKKENKLQRNVWLVSMFIWMIGVLIPSTMVRAVSKPQISCSSVYRSSAVVADAWIYSDTAGSIYYVVDENDAGSSTLGAGSIAANGTAATQKATAGKIAKARILTGLTSGKKYAHIVVVDDTDSSNVSNVVTVALPMDYWYHEDFEAYPDAYNSTENEAGFEFGPRVSIAAQGNDKVLSVIGAGSSVGIATGQGQDNCITIAKGRMKSSADSPTAAFKLGFSGELESTQYGSYHQKEYEIAGVYVENGIWKSGASGVSRQVLDLMEDTTMQKDTWYTVSLVYETQSHTYDVYVNGKRANSQPIAAAVFDTDTVVPEPAVNRLMVESAQLQYTYYDDVESYSYPTDRAGVPDPKVQFSEPAGNYTSARRIELFTQLDDRDIYYTTDGSYPDPSNSASQTKKYNGASITVDETTTIRAVAGTGSGSDFTPDSLVTFATYTILGNGQLRGQSVNRVSPALARVYFVSNVNGDVYYCVRNTSDLPQADDNSAGWVKSSTTALQDTVTVLSVSGLVAGKQYVNLVVKDEQGNYTNVLQCELPHELYLKEDFSIYPDGAESGTGIVQLVSGSQKIKYLEENAVLQKEADSQCSISLSYFAASTYVAETKIRFTKASPSGYFRLGTIGVAAINGEWWACANGSLNGQKLTLANDEIEKDRWYTLRLVFNRVDKEFDVYIDGRRVNEEPITTTDLGSSVQNVNLILQTTSASAPVYYDDLRVYALGSAYNNANVKFDKASATYTSETDITLSTSLGDRTIYYTTDGSYPDLKNNAANTYKYVSPIHVDETMTITALAGTGEGSSFKAESIATAETYTISEGIRLVGNSAFRASATLGYVWFHATMDGTVYYKVTTDSTAPSAEQITQAANQAAVTYADAAAKNGAAVQNTITKLHVTNNMTAGPKYVHVAMKDDDGTLSNVLTYYMPYDVYFYEDFESNLSTSSPKNTTNGANFGLSASATANQTVRDLGDGHGNCYALKKSSSATQNKQEKKIDGTLRGGTWILEAAVRTTKDASKFEISFNTDAGIRVDSGVWKSLAGTTYTPFDQYTQACTKDEWHTVRIVYDTAADQKVFDVYIDGKRANSEPIAAEYTTASSIVLKSLDTNVTYFDDVECYYLPAASDAVVRFTPAAGTYDSQQTISLSTLAGDREIYYTTDGTYPDVADTEHTKKYTAAFIASKSMTVSALAGKTTTVAGQSVWKPDSIAYESEYTIDTTGPASCVIPTAGEETLTYDGSSQCGIVYDTQLTAYSIVSGEAEAVDAGSHQAVFRLKNGYKWADGTTADKTVFWSIAPKQISMTATASKAYDGTVAANVRSGALEGVISADSGNVSVTQTQLEGTYDNQYAGTNKTVTLKSGNTFTLTGTKAGNYDLVTLLSGEITPAVQTLSKAKDLNASGGESLTAAQLAEAVSGAQGTLSFAIASGSDYAAYSAEAGLTIGENAAGQAITIKAVAAAADLGGTSVPEYAADTDGVLFVVKVADKAVQTLRFEQSEVTASYGSEFVGQTAVSNVNDGGTVTYTGDNDAVALVNATSGAVTIKGVGKVTVTASASQTANYASAFASYVLNVNKGSRSAPQVGKTDETIAGRHDGTLTGLTIDMEYKLKNASAYTAIAESDLTDGKLAGLAAGTYCVRYKESANYNVSPYATVTIGAGGTDEVLSFAKSILTAVYGDTGVGQSAVSNVTDGGTISYTGDNNAVATVDAASGAVTITGVGTVHITAQSAPKGFYYGTSTSYTLIVGKAEKAAPKVGKTDETIAGRNDGSLTGLTTDMEYHKAGTTVYTAITESILTDGKLTGLAAGTYYVRYKESTNYKASADTAVEIGVGGVDEVLSFTQSTLTATYGDTGIGQIASSNVADGGAITYESDNSAVAAVHTTTGAITINGAGTAHITATSAPYGIYSGTSASYTLIVAKADQAAPQVDKTDETIEGRNDGSLTRLTSDMEYRLKGSDKYKAVVDSDLTDGSLTGLAAGTYYVRYKENANYNASPDTTVTIGAGKEDEVLSFAQSTLTVRYTDTGVGQIASSNVADGGAITYSGDNPAVAIVDSTSGAVTITGVGNVHITAASAASGVYYGTSASYTLIVKKADKTAPKVGKTDETIAGKNDGSITGLNADMEYRNEGTDIYTSIKDSSLTDGRLTGLAAGTYYVRYKESANYLASEAAAVVIGIGGVDEVLSFAQSTLTATYGDTGVGQIASSNVTDGGTITYESDDTTVAKVDETTGAVTITGVGSAHIIATSTANGKYSGTSASYTLRVKKADRSAPEAGGINETITGKNDGSLTGLTTQMEYRLKEAGTYESIAESALIEGKLTGLAAGTYFVRYKETAYYNASPDTTVVIGEGVKDEVLCFDKSHVTVRYTDTAVGQIAYSSVADGGTITYESDNTEVAEVNSVSGAITIRGVGTAHITATSEAAGVYSGTSTSYTLTVEKAEQTAPTIGKTDETEKGKADGSLTGLTAEMEYRRADLDTYKAIEESDLTEGRLSSLAPGTYYVRYKENANYNASADTEVTIKEGAQAGTDQKEEILSFAKNGITAVYGDTGIGQSASSNVTDGGTIRYSSDNEKVATVDSVSGAVTIKGAGVAHITAATQATAVYKEASATYTLMVEKANQSIPTVGKEDETVKGKKDGSLTGLTTDMEYRKDGESTYTAVVQKELTDGKLTGLEPGIYYVRYKENVNYKASADVTVAIAAGSESVEDPGNDPKEDPKPQEGQTDQTDITPVTDYDENVPLEVKEAQITSISSDKKDVEGSAQRYLMLKSSPKNTTIKLSWKEVPAADGYVIYGSPCGAKMQPIMTIESRSVKSFVVNGLKKGQYYKYTVAAYRNTASGRRVITTSKTIFVATTGGKKGNPLKLKLAKSKLTIKKGKKQQIKASYTFKLKVQNRTAKYRYESADPKIATVTKKGVVKGVAKGKTMIYVYTQNGLCKTVKVTVK
ncbi:MAG: hypothetical protein E7294_00005 [Lachnospiraceae bacterium]|nr:hypothetical protein [Lachnospiraceae bacterium]